MREKYIKNNFWTDPTDNNVSVIWKNILKFREELKLLIERKIANGSKTDLWKDS